MKKCIKIFLIVLTLFIVSGCSSTSIKTINYGELNTMIQNKESFILYIGSATCINCTEFSPKFEKVVNKYDIQNVYSVDLDEFSKEEKKEFNKIVNVTGTPTVAFITNGEEKSSYNRIVGNVSTEKIINRLKSNEYIK